MGLTRLRVRNYRALADIDIELKPVNVVFGPNGAGKSTLLDAVYFFRDCAIRGVETAASTRDHGIGMLWDGADEGSPIVVELFGEAISYELSVSLAAGRIDPSPGERLVLSRQPLPMIKRVPGSDTASMFYTQRDEMQALLLREPEKLSLGLFLDFNHKLVPEASVLDRLLRRVRWHHSRSYYFATLKWRGSASSPRTRLRDSGSNAWSVLRNVQDKRNVDARYGTVMGYMREAFPSFDDIVLEQTGPGSVYASFLEKGRRQPISASGASDGMLHLLLTLLALFSEGPGDSVLLLDEPETSLHPWGIVVLAKAVKHAAAEWQRQVVIATHSPVLISQFEPDDVLVAGMDEGAAKFDRLSEMEEIGDLLEEYAAGALYMSELVARQSPEVGINDDAT